MWLRRDPSTARFGASPSRARRRRARRSRRIAPIADPRLVYADSSALVKLVVDEPESDVLASHLAAESTVVATSRIALVEVPRATSIANPSAEAREETARLLESCLLIDVTDALLRSAAALTSVEIRTLDAIHLASAGAVEPDEVATYDRRLAEAARGLGLSVSHPGVPG